MYGRSLCYNDEKTGKAPRTRLVEGINGLPQDGVGSLCACAGKAAPGFQKVQQDLSCVWTERQFSARAGLPHHPHLVNLRTPEHDPGEAGSPSTQTWAEAGF